ncbi:bifunctional methionine sulfoxide reductase B/A protein [Candidatus Sulfurimonas marisnigri]|uniref:Peptide methionine sulfoxide reductase MsrA n=1 Tax=Candidatus Sulfurimonas marisnigri TaxID=2740405 RepID=A0A7S7M058_9BACT|nr:bifunctional methionine sulfoxide reductase B/A protein [Candidatus Sulfurimonas marisnigri]QOY54677.1 bifunctional methionine sulfoxide reductase B/A protein [Candidatus Sulfurimonas marisnigri]
MKLFISFILLITTMNAMDLKPWKGKIEQLSDEEKYVLLNKGTQRPFVGKYTDITESGVYSCKICETPLYKSDDKFKSNCGWPSFDDAIPGSVKRVPDADGRRVEIVCAKCGGHLGHVFEGEGYTDKNTRHCVNSISLEFNKKQDAKVDNLSKAYFAGGCFWGVEYYLEKLDGVKEVHSGFMGGHVKNPSYYEVVRSNTGHLEAVEVIYDSSKISYKMIAKTFFEIHDPTQANGQGPDIGEQYLSAVFVNNENEKNTIRELISQLEKNGFNIATKILDKQEFYKAEEDHQNYYNKKGTKPYCHGYRKRF